MSLKLNFNEIEKGENKVVKCLYEYLDKQKRGIYYVETPFVYNKGNKKLIEALYRTDFKSLDKLDDNTFIVTIPTGWLNVAFAIFILKLENNNLYIAGYAKEGIIKQNIYDKALNKIKSVLENDEINF